MKKQLYAILWQDFGMYNQIGNNNVKEYNYDQLLSNFSFVFQDVYLFVDTVKKTILNLLIQMLLTKK